MKKFNFTNSVITALEQAIVAGTLKEEELTGGLSLAAWSKVNATLRKDEGFSAQPYQDTGKGGVAVGYGRNLTQRPLSRGEGLLLTYDDVGETAWELRKRFPGNFKALSDGAQAALVMMCYQMGVDGVLKFKNTLTALVAGDKEATRLHAMDSSWYREHKNRAGKVINLLVS